MFLLRKWTSWRARAGRLPDVAGVRRRLRETAEAALLLLLIWLGAWLLFYLLIKLGWALRSLGILAN